jgi:hypothetical protein
MPDVDSHVAAARRAADTIACLRAGGEAGHQGWIACVAFYEALHWISAVAVASNSIPEPTTHGERSDQLERTNHLRKYLNAHEKLFNASLIARYLCNNRGESFDTYFAQNGILHRILSSWLYQVREESKKDLIAHGYAQQPVVAPIT